MATGTVQVNHLQKVVDQDLEEKLGQNALQQAKQATEDEHAQTLMQALRENRWAVFWSVMISMSIIMEGYVCFSLHPSRLANGHINVIALIVTTPFSLVTSSLTPSLQRSLEITTRKRMTGRSRPRGRRG